MYHTYTKKLSSTHPKTKILLSNCNIHILNITNSYFSYHFDFKFSYFHLFSAFLHFNTSIFTILKVPYTFYTAKWSKINLKTFLDQIYNVYDAIISHFPTQDKTNQKYNLFYYFSALHLALHSKTLKNTQISSLKPQ